MAFTPKQDNVIPFPVARKESSFARQNSTARKLSSFGLFNTESQAQFKSALKTLISQHIEHKDFLQAFSKLEKFKSQMDGETDVRFAIKHYQAIIESSAYPPRIRYESAKNALELSMSLMRDFTTPENQASIMENIEHDAMKYDARGLLPLDVSESLLKQSIGSQAARHAMSPRR